MAGVVSGIPSTAWALVRGRDPLEATYAAGRILLPRETRPARLIGAAALVHGAFSLGWTLALSRRPVNGVLAGASIAVLDLGAAHLIGSRRYAALRDLPVGPQVADHLAFGIAAAALLRPTLHLERPPARSDSGRTGCKVVRWTTRERPSAPRAAP